MTLITDLEHQLDRASGAQARQQLVRRLGKIERRLQGQLTKGLAPEMFKLVAACADACAAAQEVVHDYRNDT